QCVSGVETLALPILQIQFALLRRGQNITPIDIGKARLAIETSNVAEGDDPFCQADLAFDAAQRKRSLGAQRARDIANFGVKPNLWTDAALREPAELGERRVNAGFFDLHLTRLDRIYRILNLRRVDDLQRQILAQDRDRR